jgi:hypothetical protein
MVLTLALGALAGYSTKQYVQYLNRHPGVLSLQQVEQESRAFSRAFEPQWKRVNAELGDYFSRMDVLMKPIIQKIGTEPGAEAGASLNGFTLFYRDRKGNKISFPGKFDPAEREAWEKDFSKILSENADLRQQYNQLQQKGTKTWRQFARDSLLLLDHNSQQNQSWQAAKARETDWEKTRGRIGTAGALGAGIIGLYAGSRLLNRKRVQIRPPTRPRGNKARPRRQDRNRHR